LISLVGLGFLLTLVFAATTVPAFANLNGVLLTQSKLSSVTTGTIDSETSPQDIHSVYLYAGERISVDVSSPTLVLRMYGATAQFNFSGMVTPTSALVTRTAGAADPLEFEAPASATYKLRVTSNSLHEAYSLDTTITRVATFLRVTPIATSLAFNAPMSVSGWVTNWRTQSAVTDPVSGLVTLSYAGDGSAFLPVIRQPLAPAGSFTFTPAMLTYSKIWWNVVFEGNDRFAPCAGTQVVSVYASLDVLSAFRTKARTYRIQGTLNPRQAVGTYPLRVYIERKVKGTWKAYGYLKARATDGPLQEYSVLTVTKTFPNTGAWRMRPYFPGDAKTLATWGSWVSFTVK
jgi:hypothetical protein